MLKKQVGDIDSAGYFTSNTVIHTKDLLTQMLFSSKISHKNVSQETWFYLCHNQIHFFFQSRLTLSKSASTM